MRAFLVIHVFDKMPDAVSRLGYILIGIEVNFFFLERADESFSISVLRFLFSELNFCLNIAKNNRKVRTHRTD